MDEHRNLDRAQLEAVVTDIEQRSGPERPELKGLTAGALIEVYGPESVGKTTVILKRVAEVQQQGLIAAYLDCQHSVDHDYADALGVDFTTLLLFQPQSAEETLDIVRTLIPAGAVRLIAVDDIDRVRVNAQLAGSAEGAADGGEMVARVVARAAKRIVAELDCRDSTVLYTHTTVDSLDGPVSVRAAGAALSRYAAMRLDARALLTNGHSGH